ncbi:FtsX-like permease family protein [Rhodobacteraceae bacterium 2CG4]|uniref:FtsX-like permease family protein n=1 Tax=Halovulum marinum TaxID=2662447 RepID=A0A6L5YWU2_9RHOB|nr:ABC transporter permease [Halovulum marinum]MSU88332.1 FtsX-like permease family protein [Halovulum marinum]
MTGFGTLLATLLSHWRRRPWQLLALVVGLAAATALWSGVQALNAQARASYDRAAAVLGGDRFAAITGPGGQAVSVADYAALRRAGWRVSPVLDGSWQAGGDRFRLLGVEPLTLPAGAPGGGRIGTEADLVAFVTPPYRLIGSPETLARLPAGAWATRADPELPPGVLIADIALADRLLARDGRIDRLLVAPEQPGGLPPPDTLTGTGLTLTPPDESSDLAQLTDSFHLNLTAFGFLSFVVGLFIVHSTIGLAFEQRRPMVRTLRALGVGRWRLTGALLAELLVLATVAAALGMALGYGIAGALLPDVAASLRGLYGAELPGELGLRAGWWLTGFAMALAGTLVAALSALWRLHRLPVLAAAQTEAWYGAQLRTLRLQAALAAALALAAAALAWRGEGLGAGFALMAAVMLAAVLALPPVLALVLTLARRRARTPVAEWFVAESRAQIGGVSLALMALLLALSVNIGVGAMVSSFRATFLDWLDQRLAAELYVRGADAGQAAAMTAWLQDRPEVLAVLPIQSVELSRGGYPYFLHGIRDDAMYRESWPLLQAAEAPWDRVADGSGVLVSEQFARAAGLALGDRLTPGGAGPAWTPEVVGIYPDYGNPTGQAITSHARLTARWALPPPTRFAVRLTDGATPQVVAALNQRFALGPEQAVDQAALKAVSRQVFERTFAVTLALNVLTFAVAGLALLISLLTLAGMRLPQLAPLWALGLTRARLARLELVRALLLALVTAALAVPLGVLVAWILLAVVNVEAFGWRIPLRHYPGQWLQLGALAMVTASLAAALPARRLGRTPPALLLRVFSDAR